MAEHRSEQELRALFREHMPLRPMPTDLANRLKLQVLVEVANTIKVAQVAEPAIEQKPIGTTVPAQLPVRAQSKPASAPRAGIGAWLADRLRLAPSLVLTGFALAALVAIAILGPKLLPILTPSQTVGQPGSVQNASSGPADLKPSAVAQANPTATATKATALATSSSDINTSVATLTPAPSDAGATHVSTNGTMVAVNGIPAPTVTTDHTNDSPLWGTSNFAETATGTPSTPVSSGPPAQTTAIGIPTKASGNSATATRLAATRIAATPTPPASSGVIVMAPSTSMPYTAVGGGTSTATPTSNFRLENGDSTPIPTSTHVITNGSTHSAPATATAIPSKGVVGVTAPPIKLPSGATVVGGLLKPGLTATILPSGSKLTPTITPTPNVGTIGGIKVSPTPTHTSMPVATPTDTSLPTDTATNTLVPTDTPTNTPVPPTATDTATNTPVPTDTPTNTPVPPTATDTATNTPVPTDPPVPPTNTATDTPVPPTSTATDTPTATDTATYTPTVTVTLTPTDTPTVVLPYIQDNPASNGDNPVPNSDTATPLGQLYQYKFQVVDPGRERYMAEAHATSGPLSVLPIHVTCDARNLETV